MKEFLELWDSAYKWEQSKGNNSKIVLVRRKLEDGNFYDREGNEYHPFKQEETELGPISSGFVPSGWTYKDFLNRKNGSGYDWGTVKYPDGSVRPMFYKEFSVSEPGGVKYDASESTSTQEGYKNAKMKQVVEDLMKHGLNKEEAKFAYFVNEYRENKGLPKIKVSKMLVLAERKHQQDFTNHLSNYYEGQVLKPIRADLQDCWSDDNHYNRCEILHSNHSMKWDAEKVFNIWMSPNFYGERLKNLLLGEESDLVIGPAFEDGALVTCAVEAAYAPRSNLVDASEDEVLTSLKGFYANERAAIRSINAKWYEHLREKYGIKDVVGIEVYDDPTRIALEKAYHDCLDIIEIDY